MTRNEILLLRRGGGLWGVAARDVRSVTGSAPQVRILFRGAEAVADEVVGIAPGLVVTPAGAILRRFWPEPCEGLSVHAGRPVVVISSAHLPTALAGREGD